MVRIISTAGIYSYGGRHYFSSIIGEMEGFADTVMEPGTALQRSYSGRKNVENKNEKKRKQRKEKRLALMKQYEEERAKRLAEGGALNLTNCQFGGTSGKGKPRTPKYKGKTNG